jgi:hypothetical protein
MEIFIQDYAYCPSQLFLPHLPLERVAIVVSIINITLL